MLRVEGGKGEWKGTQLLRMEDGVWLPRVVVGFTLFLCYSPTEGVTISVVCAQLRLEV